MKKANMNTFAKKLTKPSVQEVTLKTPQFAGMTVQVKHRLSFSEAVGFVEQIVNSVVDMEDLTYRPEMFDFVADVALLVSYAGFEQVDCPADKMYDIVCGTDLVTEIMSYIDLEQLNTLREGAHQKVQYLCNIQASALSLKADALLSELQSMIDTGHDAINSINTKEFKDAITMFADQGVEKKNATRKRTKTATSEAN